MQNIELIFYTINRNFDTIWKAKSTKSACFKSYENYLSSQLKMKLRCKVNIVLLESNSYNTKFTTNYQF